MQMWLVIGVITVAQSAVPDAARNAGTKSRQAIDCNGLVAFSAVTTPKNARDATSGRNRIINFGTALIDRNIGYNKESGIFTAQCPGLYQLSFSATGKDTTFSLRKRPSSSTNSWNQITVTDKSGGSHVVFLVMEVGEQAAVFLDTGSLSTSSHTFSGYRVSKT